MVFKMTQRKCTENCIFSSQGRHEVCSKEQVEKRVLRPLQPHIKKVSKSFVEPDNLKILYIFAAKKILSNKMKFFYYHINIQVEKSSVTVNENSLLYKT